MKNLIKFSFIILLCSIVSCKDKCIEGSDSISETLAIADFKGIILSSSIDVTISQGATQEVTAIGSANIISHIKTAVVGEVWDIELESGCYKNFSMRIEITVPELSSIEQSGSGDLTISDFSAQQSLSIQQSGSGDMTLNEFEGIKALSIAKSGSGDLAANKDITSLENLNISSSGSGDYSGFGLQSNTVNITSSGSGDSDIHVLQNLQVNLSGSGDVTYKGNPVIQQNISGSGDLIDGN